MTIVKQDLERELESQALDMSVMQEAIEDYLASGIVGSSVIGRAYSVADAGDRKAFAEWLADFLARVLAYVELSADEEEVDDVADATE